MTRYLVCRGAGYCVYDTKTGTVCFGTFCPTFGQAQRMADTFNRIYAAFMAANGRKAA